MSFDGEQRTTLIATKLPSGYVLLEKAGTGTKGAVYSGKTSEQSMMETAERWCKTDKLDFSTAKLVCAETVGLEWWRGSLKLTCDPANTWCVIVAAPKVEAPAKEEPKKIVAPIRQIRKR